MDFRAYSRAADGSITPRLTYCGSMGGICDPSRSSSASGGSSSLSLGNNATLSRVLAVEEHGRELIEAAQWLDLEGIAAEGGPVLVADHLVQGEESCLYPGRRLGGPVRAPAPLNHPSSRLHATSSIGDYRRVGPDGGSLPRRRNPAAASRIEQFSLHFCAAVRRAPSGLKVEGTGHPWPWLETTYNQQTPPNIAEQKWCPNFLPGRGICSMSSLYQPSCVEAAIGSQNHHESEAECDHFAPRESGGRHATAARGLSISLLPMKFRGSRALSSGG